MVDVVIVSGARTPQGRIKGQLASLSAVELGTIALRAAIERSGIPASRHRRRHLRPGAAGRRGAEPRQADGDRRRCRLEYSGDHDQQGVPVRPGGRHRRGTADPAGEAQVVAAGGQESMTNAPHVLPGSRLGWNYGTMSALDTAAHDGLTDAFDHDSMGASTERFNTKLGIDRTEQDEVAAWLPPKGRSGAGSRAVRRGDRAGHDPAPQGRPDRSHRRRGRPPEQHDRVARRIAAGVRRGRHDHGGQLLTD